jgi:hypothetical protein
VDTDNVDKDALVTAVEGNVAENIDALMKLVPEDDQAKRMAALLNRTGQRAVQNYRKVLQRRAKNKAGRRSRAANR